MSENLPTLTATLFVALENVLQESLTSDATEKPLDGETDKALGKERLELVRKEITSSPLKNVWDIAQSEQKRVIKAFQNGDKDQELETIKSSLTQYLESSLKNSPKDSPKDSLKKQYEAALKAPQSSALTMTLKLFYLKQMVMTNTFSGEIKKLILEQEELGKSDPKLLYILLFAKDGKAIEECRAIPINKIAITSCLKGYFFSGDFS